MSSSSRVQPDQIKTRQITDFYQHITEYPLQQFWKSTKNYHLYLYIFIIFDLTRITWLESSPQYSSSSSKRGPQTSVGQCSFPVRQQFKIWANTPGCLQKMSILFDMFLKHDILNRYIHISEWYHQRVTFCRFLGFEYGTSDTITIMYYMLKSAINSSFQLVGWSCS